MLSFIQLILVYTFIETVILLFLLGRGKSEVHAGIEVQKTRRFTVSFLFTIGLITYMLPHAFMLAINRFSYPNPDTYHYVVSIEKQLPWHTMPIDPYYKVFPIYVILGSVIHIVLNLRGHEALVLIHLTSITLMLISTILLISNVEANMKNKGLFLLLYPLIFACSIYLYGYMEIMIPQTFALAVLIMLIVSSSRILAEKSFSNAFVFVLITLISLVHFGTIPTYILILFLTILASLIVRRLQLLKDIVSGIHGYTRSLLTFSVLAILIHIFYTSFACNLADLVQSINYYVRLLNDFLFEPNKATIPLRGTIEHGFKRPLLYVNAFGPAAFLSLTLVGIYMLLRKMFKSSLTISSCLIVGLIYIVLGFSKLYIATEIPSWSLARYVNVYGLLLLGLFNTYVLRNLVKTGKKYIKLYVALILVLGFIGSLLDPFTFLRRPSFADVKIAKSLSVLLPTEASVCFATKSQRYLLDPLLSLWAFLADKKIMSTVCLSNNTIFKYDILYNAFTLKVYLIDKGILIASS